MDIEKWLRGLELQQYAVTFRDNAIDAEILPELTDVDLEKLGVVLGHRKRLLKAIAALAAPVAAAQATSVGSAPSHGHDAERRQLTVMFCDLVGSTALAARLDPEDMREIVGAYHRCCADLITKASGFVAKYMGDGVLAYFGYPQAHEHDAERAVRAGLALVEAVPKLTTAASAPLQVRVGIATGLVVVGDLIGTGAAQEQAVVGETPNLAARLQALAEPGAVVIASSTRRLTGGLFEYRDLGAVALKGFAENVPAWQVLGAGVTESRFEAFHSTALTPIVGRDEEIDLLMRRWAQAKRGDGCVVLISGEPGIGKSRIAQTVLERISAEPYTRLRYFCSPHHQDSALYPSITQLERAAGFRREDTSEQRLAKLEVVLSQGTNDLSEVVPLLADLLSIPIGDRYPPLNLTPQKRKEKTLHAQLAQVEGLAARQPVLMVWRTRTGAILPRASPFDLLIDAGAHAACPCNHHLPAGVLATVGRSSARDPSQSQPPAVPSTRRDDHARDRRQALPKEIADQIVDRTDGVPLFVEELTKAVVESGVLSDAGDHYTVAGPLPLLAIPTSLNASLLARLDRLAPVREVAQIGAALGRQFSHELISAVAAVPREQLDDALAQLVRAELIFRRGTPPDAEYTFKHALAQDAAYSTLLRGRRQQLHARIAVTLEDQFPEIVLTQPALLARHCAEAGLSEKAVAYWLKAGRQAMARSAMTEAVAQLRKGLDALTALPDGLRRRQQELDLQLALRPALAFTKGLSAPDVGETIARARALAEQLDRPEDLVRLSFGQWAFHLGRSEYKLALSLAEQIEKIAEARNDVSAQLRGRRANGMTRLHLGEFVAARALLDQGHGLADAHRGIGAGLADPYATMLAYLAVTLAYLGYIDQSRLRLEEALTETRRLRHAQTLTVVLIFANWTGWITRSPVMGRYTEELLAISTEHRLPFHFGWATAFHGASLTALGQAHEGLTLLTQGLEALRATGTVTNTSIVLMRIAEAYAMVGQPSDGLNCLAEAAQIIETTDERCHEAELHRLRGDLLNATGDPSAAKRSYHQALTVAKLQSAKLLELQASVSLARLWCKQNRHGEARDLLAPIYGWFTEGFDAHDLKEAKLLLEELHA